MHTLFHILIAAIAVYVSSLLIPGATIEPYWIAIVVAIVLGLVNLIVKPFIQILTLPINVLTLGLFSIIINAALISLVAAMVDGFKLASFWDAILYSIVLWLVNWFFSSIAK